MCTIFLLNEKINSFIVHLKLNSIIYFVFDFWTQTQRNLFFISAIKTELHKNEKVGNKSTY